MTEICPPSAVDIDMEAIEAKLSGLTPEKLKFRFFECFNGAAEFIAEAAVCLKLLKRHGQEYLAGMPRVGTFLRIAEGQVDPNALWQFIESPNRQRVERLPLSDQKRLAADPTVEVLTTTPEGKYTKQMVDLRKAPRDVAALAIGPDGIRSPDEQAAYLNTERIRVVAKPKPPVEKPTERFVVMFTPSQAQIIRTLAAHELVSDGEMIAKIVEEAGTFRKRVRKP